MIIETLPENIDVKKYREIFSNIKKKIDKMKKGPTISFKRFLEDISVSSVLRYVRF